jgi:hypothetical protein
MTVPDFTFGGYAELLDRLHDVGIPQPYVRHDIDLFVSPHFIRLAEEEQRRGISSQWFIRDEAAGYNPSAPEVNEILHELYRRGHSFGYHYPITRFMDIAAIHGRMSVLADRTGLPMTAVVGHRPEASVVRDQGRDSSFNPHNFMSDAPYISDSRRQWRIDVMPTLEDILTQRVPIRNGRLHINLHPEWWLTYDPVQSNERYLQSRLRLHMERNVYDILREERDSW